MKKLLLTCSALLILVGFAATGVQATTCFDFDWYCDGLELSLSGGSISGWWRNTDCAGTDVPVSGFVSGGMGYVRCDWPADPCPVSHDWGFLIDGLPLDGTMDMYSNTGSGWTIWIDELLYTPISGPCPFAPEDIGNGEPSAMAFPEYDQ